MAQRTGLLVPCLAAAAVFGLPSLCRAGQGAGSNPPAAPRTLCPHCTAEASADAKFCARCGRALSGQEAAPAPAPEPASPPEVVYPVFKIGGFHDLSYFAGRRTSPRGFAMGQFVLHTNSLMSPHIQFFSEVSFSPRPDAGLGTPAAPGYNVDIERAILRYDHSDLFRFSAGRYHTPVNWWNTAYHHGQWLQTTVSRPEMVRFGGQFIPVHFVGGLVEGLAQFREFGLSYKAGLGNGRASAVSRAGDFGDNNGATARLLNLSLRPERLYGLQVGGALYRDTITLADGQRFDENLTSAHVVLETETPEVIAEFARSTQRGAGGSRSSSEAYYLQVAYRLPILDKKFKPYYRYERVRVPASSVVFRETPSLRGGLVGVRWDFSDFAAFKLEYRNLDRAFNADSRGFATQLSFMF